ncbi:hypothetical protein BGP89_00155 [Luteimonas sp. JM171]|uniref:hypothetical protein n=1 Tax=Luteimonas sp. JM171 TaxID=1896164 RepID=UPI0012FCA704|nr:hypothetical protein [Luteimonas sp. JM171]
MALTLGFTSMDQATETALRAAFSDANAKLQGLFSLASSDAADYVIIDMDSMYGPMGWLRLHAAGKQVIGLTSAARTQADFRIGRPFDTGSMMEVLQQVAASEGVEARAATTATVPLVPAATADAVDAPPAAPSGLAPAPEPVTEEPAGKAPEAPEASNPQSGEAPGSAADAAAPAPAATGEAADGGDDPAAHGPGPDPEPETALPPRDPMFVDWMMPGALRGRLRYRRGNGPALWIDADARQYHGPQQLKPLVEGLRGTVTEADFEPVDDATWAEGSAAAGEAQPLSRLQWLGGLLAGNGELLPGNDPEGRYRLTRWPQTEREYPRHFRIATAMMKGPATLAEIAEASGSPLAEVVDFANANLATGFAEFVPEPEPEPEAPARPTGFFRRLRGRT